MLRIFIYISVLLFTTTSFAAVNISSAKLNKKKKFAITTRAVTSSKLQDQDDPTYTLGTSFLLYPSYRISKKLRLHGLVGASQGHNQETKSELFNTRVQLSMNKRKLFGKVRWTPSAAIYLPTNSVTRIDESFNTAISVRPSFETKFRVAKQKFSVDYMPDLRRNFHAFDIAATGLQNIEYKLSHSGGISTKIIKNVSLGVDVRFDSAWAYNGELFNSFLVGESIAYQATKDLSIAIGHSNDASTLRPNGRDSNVALYDESTSTVYSDLIYKF